MRLGKRDRMNKQEHCYAWFGEIWNNNRTRFEHNFDNENMIAEQWRNAYATQKTENGKRDFAIQKHQGYPQEKRRQRHDG